MCMATDCSLTAAPAIRCAQGRVSKLYSTPHASECTLCVHTLCVLIALCPPWRPGGLKSCVCMQSLAAAGWRRARRMSTGSPLRSPSRSTRPLPQSDRCLLISTIAHTSVTVPTRPKPPQYSSRMLTPSGWAMQSAAAAAGGEEGAEPPRGPVITLQLAEPGTDLASQPRPELELRVRLQVGGV